MSAYETGFDTNSSSGVIVQVETDEFQRLLKEVRDPMVVHQKPSWWQPYHRYLLNYRGMTFYIKTKQEISISKYVNLVSAKNFHNYIM